MVVAVEVLEWHRVVYLHLVWVALVLIQLQLVQAEQLVLKTKVVIQFFQA